MAKLLIDECLHTSLLKLAHEAGHTTDHVNHLGLGSSKDWDLMKLILNRDYTFVTNIATMGGNQHSSGRPREIQGNGRVRSA